MVRKIFEFIDSHMVLICILGLIVIGILAGLAGIWACEENLPK